MQPDLSRSSEPDDASASVKLLLGRYKDARCPLSPYCGKTIDCGRKRKNLCSVFGTGGSREHEKPSDAALAVGKRRMRDIKKRQLNSINE